jgi:hypothetical protein
MIKLQIRKKTARVWQHFITDGENFILSKCYCKTNGDKFRVVEDGGTAKKEYLFSEIEVYDDLSGGSAETFTSSLQLMNRLSALNYVGFSKDGDVITADLISSDSSNALIQGADGKLYVPNVDTSSFATTTQLNDGLATKAPTNHTHTIAQINGLEDALKYENVSTNSSITGTYAIDYNIDIHRLTLTGNTTFTESNLPPTGKGRTITLEVNGNFGVVFPSSFTTFLTGAYKGTATLNTIVIECFATFRKVQISQPD